MIMVSVCLPSDALSQRLPSYWDFSDLGCGVSPLSCSPIQHHVATAIPYNCTVEVKNRFKGLYLIDRVLDVLWTEVHDIVQETGIKTKKKHRKGKWLSEEALQIAEKRREV